MKRIWDIDELAEHWSLKFEETRLLKTKPARNHLPFAVQLKFYQNTGRFPSAINEIPETPLHYLAEQLEVDVFGVQEYEWSGRTGARHRKEILSFLGIRRVSATDKHAFSDWLIATLYPHGSDPADATEAAFGWFQQRQVECPADKELERLVRSSFQQFELHLKPALFAAVLRNELAKVALAVPVQSFAVEDIGDYAGRAYDYHLENPELSRLMRWEGLAYDGEVPDEELRREYYGYKVQAVTDGQHQGVVTRALDADHLAFLILALAGWWSAVPQVARMLTGPDSAEEHARRRASVVEAARRLATTP
jgi:hypothetical protein